MAAIDYDLLFTRLGKIGHIGYVLAGDQAALPALITDIIAEYDGTADDDLIGALTTAQAQTIVPVVAPPSSLGTLAQATLTRMVNTSVPSISGVVPALVELIRQMRADSESVAACAVAVSGAALSTNVGNGVVVVSPKRGDGLYQENIIAEVARLQCSSDSYTGGAQVGQEPFQLAGAVNTVGVWNYNSPEGSEASAFLQAIPASLSPSQTGNVLTNGDMEDWTDDATPELENWTLETGTWGTDALRSTTAYAGTYSLRINAGATDTTLYQEFDNGTDGTSVALQSLTSYAFNFFMRAVAGTVSAGVLTIELVDNTGTVINDQQGVANSFTKTLSTLTTSWSAVNGVFRVPNVPPTVMRFRLRISTDLAGDAVLIDDAAGTNLTASYPGGWGFAVFAGEEPFVAGDGWDITATNDRAGQSYLGTFQSLFARYFPMMQSNLLLPSSGTPTQADTKITT